MGGIRLRDWVGAGALSSSGTCDQMPPATPFAPLLKFVGRCKQGYFSAYLCRPSCIPITINRSERPVCVPNLGQALPTWAASQCASSDHQRKPLESLLAYCHMCPRTNHSGETGLLGTVSRIAVAPST
ncbi:hypothetical protein HaLaN_03493 [Haematococcus lacustris]|uniref:Uncharacterized protein n=1 Tax=Haematococcus lacustris TaxID=44745 RepID=A0A699YNN3_HAELA|nr:hypothetical protein HaLaN_03493 [Haematococcus lacustris]